eukprot:jgi/Chrzof1/2721/Cz11g26150.t1
MIEQFNQTSSSEASNVKLAVWLAANSYPWIPPYHQPLPVRSTNPAALGALNNATMISAYKSNLTNMLNSTGLVVPDSIQFTDWFDGNNGAHFYGFRTTDGIIFVVIRGTDAQMDAANNDIAAYRAAFFGSTVTVHRGFYYRTYHVNLWSPIKAFLDAQIPLAGAAAKVVIVGHSRGGAQALYCAMNYATAKNNSIADSKLFAVYTFGAPRAGNTCGDNEVCWVTLYNRSLGNMTYSYWRQLDGVPTLPPFLPLLGIRYGQTGSIYRVWNGQVYAPGADMNRECPVPSGRCDWSRTDHEPVSYLTELAQCQLG